MWEPLKKCCPKISIAKTKQQGKSNSLFISIRKFPKNANKNESNERRSRKKTHTHQIVLGKRGTNFAAIHKSRIIRHRPFFFVLPWKWASNAQLKPKNTSTWESQANLLRRNSDWKSNFGVFGAAFFLPFYHSLSLFHAHARTHRSVGHFVHSLKSSSHVLHIFGKTLRTHFKPYGRPYDRYECKRDIAKRKRTNDWRQQQIWIESNRIKQPTRCVYSTFCIVCTVRRARRKIRSNEMCREKINVTHKYAYVGSFACSYWLHSLARSLTPTEPKPTDFASVVQRVFSTCTHFSVSVSLSSFRFEQNEILYMSSHVTSPHCSLCVANIQQADELFVLCLKRRTTCICTVKFIYTYKYKCI